jgi:hypothetical protein
MARLGIILIVAAVVWVLVGALVPILLPQMIPQNIVVALCGDNARLGTESVYDEYDDSTGTNVTCVDNDGIKISERNPMIPLLAVILGVSFPLTFIGVGILVRAAQRRGVQPHRESGVDFDD